MDCAFLLVRVYHAVGLIPDIDPRPYPHDWHLHRGEERYLDWVSRYGRPVSVPMPGDVVLFRFGRCASHAAIVVDWPRVIHSYIGEGVTLGDADKAPLSGREAGFFRVAE